VAALRRSSRVCSARWSSVGVVVGFGLARMSARACSMINREAATMRSCVWLVGPTARASSSTEGRVRRASGWRVRLGTGDGRARVWRHAVGVGTARMRRGRSRASRADSRDVRRAVVAGAPRFSTSGRAGDGHDADLEVCTTMAGLGTGPMQAGCLHHKGGPSEWPDSAAGAAGCPGALDSLLIRRGLGGRRCGG
jgi:hypothetical protein